MSSLLQATPLAAQPPGVAGEEIAPHARLRLGRQTVAILGLGYVGLPTALALAGGGYRVIGVDIDQRRLDDIRARRVDLIASDHDRLAAALDEDRIAFTVRPRFIALADMVVICVPTPVDAERRPDLTAVRAACATAVAHARPGQTLVLTSTTYVGTTRDLLIGPLAERGLVAGEDVHVVFSPERIDPGNDRFEQTAVPRVVGGATPACAAAAARVLGDVAAEVHEVSSPEAAELTKLLENTFRAVNIALSFEIAQAARHLGLDPVEAIGAAASKPYGFMPFYPSAGVGGHCIPCDPHYLLSPLHEQGVRLPVIEHAMDAIAERPDHVVRRAAELLGADDIAPGDARVLVVGAAYKPGVQDVRESPSLEIIHGLLALGARVEYHDPLVDSIRIDSGLAMLSTMRPAAEDYDLAVVAQVHPGHDYDWLACTPRVLDCTYRLRGLPSRLVP